MFRLTPDRKQSTDTLMRCIAEVEVRTCAEIVLAIRPNSGSYRDINWLVGFACSFVLLNLYLFLPQEVPALSIPVPILFAFLAGAAASDRLGLSVRLAGSQRRRRQVGEAARNLFLDHVAGRTRDRTGILIYLSSQEKAARLELDTKALTALKPDLLDEIRSRFDHELSMGPSSTLAARIGGVLRSLGVALEHCMPPEDASEDRDNQLPDDLIVHSGSEPSS
jgi:uncharacterized membrane protein